MMDVVCSFPPAETLLTPLSKAPEPAASAHPSHTHSGQCFPHELLFFILLRSLGKNNSLKCSGSILQMGPEAASYKAKE